MTTLTAEQVAAFLHLACALSPENLSCDGELSRAAVARKYKGLMKQWKALEAKVGRKVTEDEVWTAHLTIKVA